MAQTDLEKAIARINQLRSEGKITQEQAQTLRKLARERANQKGDFGAQGRKALNDAISQATSGRQSGGSGGGAGSDSGGSGGSGGSGESGGNRPPRPGTAWVWSPARNKWIRPPAPGDGNHTWDDNRGWVPRSGTEDSLGRPVEPGGPVDGPAGRPGAAWIWDGTKWTRPPEPAGEGWVWDDESGWTQPNEGGEPGGDAGEQERTEEARASLRGLLERYGLTELFDTLDSLLTEFGGNEVIIMSRLRESEVYRQRFSGNQARIQAGYSALTEADYLRMENEYKKAMRNYGLADSYYSRDSLAKLIGGDVSEAEVESRISVGQRMLEGSNQNVLRELQEYYPEITTGDLLSYLLDPAQGQEVLVKKIRTGMIGGAAEQAGFTMSRQQSELLGMSTVGQTLDPFRTETQAQLEQTFGRAREESRRDRVLAGIDMEEFEDMDTLRAAFGDTERQLASQRRAARERARFSGETGVGRSSLSVRRRDL